MAALDYLDSNLADTMDKYMAILSRVGYKSYCAVDKLLVYMFIEELLADFKDSVTEEDYNSMANVINCFYGSCLMPFPRYVGNSESNTPIFYYYHTMLE